MPLLEKVITLRATDIDVRLVCFVCNSCGDVPEERIRLYLDRRGYVEGRTEVWVEFRWNQNLELPSLSAGPLLRLDKFCLGRDTRNISRQIIVDGWIDFAPLDRYVDLMTMRKMLRYDTRFRKANEVLLDDGSLIKLSDVCRKPSVENDGNDNSDGREEEEDVFFAGDHEDDVVEY